MRATRPLSSIWTCLTLISVTSLAGCGAHKLMSVWCDRDVAIDGHPTEWQGSTTYIKDEAVAIGVMNDSDYLYVSLSTSVRSLAAQILAQGFTVWLDGEGGKHKSFGVRCPIGFPPETKDRSQSGDTAGDREKFSDMIADRLESSAEQLEIVGPGKEDVTRLLASEVPGLEIALGHQDGRFVYELKAPLRSSEEHPYAIGLDEDRRSVGVGFETTEIEMKDMADEGPPAGRKPGGGRPGGGPPGDGVPGGGMSGRGRPGGGRGSGGGLGSMPERLELWAKVDLALAPDQVEER
jgi:hypothetical protein